VGKIKAEMGTCLGSFIIYLDGLNQTWTIFLALFQLMLQTSLVTTEDHFSDL